MNKYHIKVDLPIEQYTSYFMEEFIPKYNFDDQLDDLKGATRLLQYHDQQYLNDPGVKSLNALLKGKYGFPDIEYFVIFRHYRDQPVHRDGAKVLRYASLNLPLCGVDNTVMRYYKLKDESIQPTKGEAFFYKLEDCEPVYEFNCTREWTLVNSADPHNIVGIDPANPRYTVCVRFKGNPPFSYLANRVASV